MICCLFGHRDCTEEIKPSLVSFFSELIDNQKVDAFYVGEQGGFDLISLTALSQLKIKYPHIRFYVVLPYLPTHPRTNNYETILPEGIENIYPRFAIPWRNRWMIRNSDLVAVYVKYGYGGAAQAMDYARKIGKKVINIATIK